MNEAFKAVAKKPNVMVVRDEILPPPLSGCKAHSISTFCAVHTGRMYRTCGRVKQGGVSIAILFVVTRRRGGGGLLAGRLP